MATMGCGRNSLLRRDLAMLQEQPFAMSGDATKVDLTNNLHQLIFRCTCPTRYVILHKKPALLGNCKKAIFPLKRAFLIESQRVVRRLSNQISSFRIGTQHYTFLIYWKLAFVFSIESTTFYVRNSQFGKASRKHQFFI